MIAVVGPTASGKTALALRIAEALGAEIVSADSRLVYRGLDIATAKPTPEERARVPHHQIDVADPDERYDVARYQREARAALDAIASRGRPAVIVGGTGLYVRALLDGLDLAAAPTDPETRARVEELARDGGEPLLRARLRALDAGAESSVPAGNLRRLIRYLELATLRGSVHGGRRREPSLPAERIGLAPGRDALRAAIAARADAMARGGVLEETRGLLARGLDPRLPGMTAHGYVHWARHLAGECSLEEAIAATVRDTRAYARRQMTWFRRDPLVRWSDPAVTDPFAAVVGA